MFCDIDLIEGDKIVFVGSEDSEFFTEGRIYEIQRIASLTTLSGKKTHLVVIDDDEEESYISMSFYNKNFRKVMVTIEVSSDGSFTTETDMGSLYWGNSGFEDDLELLTSILDYLNVGFEIIENGDEDYEQ